MLIAHTVEKDLSIFCIIDNLHRHVLCHHSGECLGYLIFISLRVCRIFHISIRLRVFRLCECDLSILCGEGVSGLCCCQLRDGSDISRKQL